MGRRAWVAIGRFPSRRRCAKWIAGSGSTPADWTNLCTGERSGDSLRVAAMKVEERESGGMLYLLFSSQLESRNSQPNMNGSLLIARLGSAPIPNSHEIEKQTPHPFLMRCVWIQAPKYQ